MKTKVSDRVDRVPASEAIDFDFIPNWIKPKTIKIDIHGFLAGCSAIKETVWSLHRVW